MFFFLSHGFFGSSPRAKRLRHHPHLASASLSGLTWHMSDLASAALSGLRLCTVLQTTVHTHPVMLCPLCCATPLCVMLHHFVMCDTPAHVHTPLCCAAPLCAMLHTTMCAHPVMPCLWCHAAPHCAMLHHFALCCTPLHAHTPLCC